LLVGVSSGCNVASGLKLSEEIDEGVIVTVLCDSADKYLSERFWEEE
jgi:cysteine synthase B